MWLVVALLVALPDLQVVKFGACLLLLEWTTRGGRWHGESVLAHEEVRGSHVRPHVKDVRLWKRHHAAARRRDMMPNAQTQSDSCRLGTASCSIARVRGAWDVGGIEIFQLPYDVSKTTLTIALPPQRQDVTIATSRSNTEKRLRIAATKTSQVS